MFLKIVPMSKLTINLMDKPKYKHWSSNLNLNSSEEKMTILVSKYKNLRYFYRKVSFLMI